MAKNRQKKKKNGSAETAMDIAPADNSSQAMDTSENLGSSVSVGVSLRKTKKGRPMKRSKNVRKLKAVAKAICQTEKSVEKVSKGECKIVRTKSAKNLYD
ncbi:hypothetical protein ABFS82_13G177600 [Erythranthe guttata]|uniref:Uncharacterized protein n=1 Tax=Erythranthe guttata TaxID=4155 RepID=A0A022PY59_ERYGU|nr:PREDICTED: uncharacterized protein LOC105948730 [Erythranthe guttata]EYU19160.1 hypothetical protein MIMGU_mgv1a016969mg [Erythranthe guttata]|eukprot:XP_012827411.1 PREDICTED: uncharacterized protein LOC105948730 [Erythranthe guttata]